MAEKVTRQGVRDLNSMKPKHAPRQLSLPCVAHRPGKPYMGLGWPNVAFDDDLDMGWPAMITECLDCGERLGCEYIF